MNWVRKSLANTLTALIAVILLLVFSIIGITSFNYITGKVEKDLLEQTSIQSESISKDVVDIFEDAEIYTRQMSMNSEIVSYLKEVKSLEDVKSNKRYPYIYDYLVKVKESESLHFLAWVANEQANFYLDSYGNIPSDEYRVKMRPWYDIAVNSDTVAFTAPYIEWGTGKTVISSILAMREKNEVFGFVVVDIMLDSIPEIIEEVSLNEGDKTFIVTESGKYMHHHDKSYVVERSIHDEGDLLKPFLTTIEMSDKELDEVIYDGKSYYMMSYKIDINGWKVITLIDQSVIKNEIFEIFMLIVIVMLLLFFLASGSIYLLVGYRTAPYKTLVSFAEAIAMGEYSKNIPKEYIQREDEMGHISRSFQKVISTFRDEHVLLEEKVDRVNAVLEKQYEYILETEKAASLGNLVAGVAHEINTPLGVGVSTSSYINQLTTRSLEKMDSNTMSKEDLIRYFEKVSESTRILDSNLGRAAELIKSFKKIAVDQSSEIKELFILKNVIEDVVVSLRSEYKSKNITIDINCNKSITLESYPGLFAQLVTNLMMNAIQHGLKNRDSGHIKIDCEIDSDLLYFIFEDNGSGISEEIQKSMYEPFYTTNREHGNSGLGMSIIQNIVTQSLEGKIKMDSVVEEYTRFTIVLPVNNKEKNN